MNRERNNTAAVYMALCGLFDITLIVLKLTGVLKGSWLWVLAPIWIPTAIILAIIGFALVVVLVREPTKGGARDDHGGASGPAGSCDHDLWHCGIKRESEE